MTRVFVRRQHDRSRVKIAMDQRLGARQELEFARLRRDLHRRIAFERLLFRIEIGARPAIERRLAIGVGEDEVLGDLAERGIGRKQRDARLVLVRASQQARKC